MTVLTFHPATPARIAHIAAHLRKADRAELAITSPGEDVHEILRESVAASRWAIVAEVDGVPAVAYGVAPSGEPMVGRAWMLATDGLLLIRRREFLARCRAEVRLMQQKFAVLTNEVHCKNTVVIRWLERLGFYIDRERPVGPNGELFVFWKGAARRV